jgi:flagella basal body P-ring formation protein FlgA
MRLALLLFTLTPLAASASEADVAAAARAAIEASWPEAAADVEVRVVRLSGAVERAQPPLRVRFAGDGVPGGRVSAKVEAQDASGAWARVGWAFLHVARFGTAAVLTRDVARGEPLADAVAAERVETTDLPNPPLSPDALHQSEAARRLRAGTVLTRRHVRAPAAVERRGALRVAYARGAVRVGLDCQARERGAVGEEVRAVCSGLPSTLRVRLTAPGEGVWTATL